MWIVCVTFENRVMCRVGTTGLCVFVWQCTLSVSQMRCYSTVSLLNYLLIYYCIHTYTHSLSVLWLLSTYKLTIFYFNFINTPRHYSCNQVISRLHTDLITANETHPFRTLFIDIYQLLLIQLLFGVFLRYEDRKLKWHFRAPIRLLDLITPT